MRDTNDEDADYAVQLIQEALSRLGWDYSGTISRAHPTRSRTSSRSRKPVKALLFPRGDARCARRGVRVPLPRHGTPPQEFESARKIAVRVDQTKGLGPSARKVPVRLDQITGSGPDQLRTNIQLGPIGSGRSQPRGTPHEL